MMSEPLVVTCGVCKGQLKNGHLLPCIHAFCLKCLQEECCPSSRYKFVCPLCDVTPRDDKKSTFARPWYAHEQFIEAGELEDARRKRREELPSLDGRGASRADDWQNNQSDDSDEDDWMTSTSLVQPQTFPCPSHPEKLAGSFCGKCQLAACEKCVSLFHRRCHPMYNLNDAVDANREELDRLHVRLADLLIQSQLAQDRQKDRLNAIEEMRKAALLEIKSQRVELINIILAKEKELTTELDSNLNEMSAQARDAETSARMMVESVTAQLSVLDLSIAARGEGELLSYLPALSTRLKEPPTFIEPDNTSLNYRRNVESVESLRTSTLGNIVVIGPKGTGDDNQETELALTLTPVISFHGGCRDDICDPLLTDLLLLPNGDVILTDRDNKCVKRFNNGGKLLTRVVMEVTPSRIASVSHSRAVVSAMNKKSLYFFSLHGTVRILNSVTVRKIYSFITSVGEGVLAAGTSQCDSIDILSENGQLLRQLYAQQPDRAAITRPLYLTTANPHAALSSNHSNTNNNLSQTIGHTTSNGHKNDYPALNNQRRSSTSTLLIPPNSDVSSSTSIKPDMEIPDLLVSDSGKRILFRLTSDGSVTTLLKSSQSLALECPLGVTVHESGQTLLADRDADSILQVDEDGCFKRKLLTSKDGLSKPCGIYAGQRGQVALTQVNGLVKIYSAEVKYTKKTKD